MEEHYEGNLSNRRQPPPLPINLDGEEEYEVKEILDSKRVRGQLQYLVAWEGYGPKGNTWQPAKELREDIPSLVKAFEERPRKLQKRN